MVLVRSRTATPNIMMLNAIKEKSKGIFTYVIVGLISLTFIVTALYGVDFNGSGDVVAKVGGDEISKEEFLAEFNPQKARLQQELAEKYTSDFDNVLKQSTIESMVNRRLLSQLADDLGHATTQTELQTLIQANPIFAEEGRFSLEKYKRLLRLNGYNNTQYEAVKRLELTQGQIKFNLLNSAFVLPLALKRTQELNDQQRQFSYITLKADDYSSKVSVDKDSIQNFYEQQKEGFIEPQKVKVDFLELSLDTVAKGIKVNDDALFNFFEDEKQRFSTEEERQAQHILVATEPLANEIIAQLNQGVAFSKLSMDYSLDESSKDKGGDLGFFTLGVMMPEFEAKVFSMKVGELSAPIKTEFGYHVIKLNSIQPSTVKPFESVRAELTQLYKRNQAQKSFYDLTEQLTNLAYEASLEEAADQLGLTLKRSEFFAQDSTQYEAKFVAAAYADGVLNKGENSAPIELSADKVVVLNVKEKSAQRQKSFDEVKDEISAHLTTVLATTFIDNTAQKIADLLTQGEVKSAQALMDKSQLKWQEAGWVKRDSDKTLVRIINQVFALPKPVNGATYSAHSLDNQQVVILRLSAIKTAEYTPEHTLTDAVLSVESDEMLKGVIATLRKNTAIEIFYERL